MDKNNNNKSFGSRDYFNIDIPIDEQSSIKEKEEGRLLQNYTWPVQKMLDQHQKEYKEYLRFLMGAGYYKISVDGQVVYMKQYSI